MAACGTGKKPTKPAGKAGKKPPAFAKEEKTEKKMPFGKKKGK